MALQQVAYGFLYFEGEQYIPIIINLFMPMNSFYFEYFQFRVLVEFGDLVCFIVCFIVISNWKSVSVWPGNLHLP